MLTLVKLGGSLLTDKAKSEALRSDELTRIAHEIQRAVNSQRRTTGTLERAQLIIAHGSGSFGHVPARQYETHLGRAARPDTWRRGMALVARAAAKLNGFVVNALVECDLNVLALPPRALRCDDGRVIHESARDFADAVRLALDSQLLPLLNGDVVGDTVRGCTILSTEALFAALLMHWRQRRCGVDFVRG
jgi:isopentenyl phosphate kinase